MQIILGFLKRNEIKNIRPFHRLSLNRQLALRRRKPQLKIGHVLCNSLPFIEAIFYLMDQSAVRPAILCHLFDIPDSLVWIVHLIQNDKIVRP